MTHRHTMLGAGALLLFAGLALGHYEILRGYRLLGDDLAVCENRRKAAELVVRDWVGDAAKGLPDCYTEGEVGADLYRVCVGWWSESDE